MGKHPGTRSQTAKVPSGLPPHRGRRFLLAGISAVLVVLASVAYFEGINRTPAPSAANSNRSAPESFAGLPGSAAPEDPLETLLSRVLDDAEDSWTGILKGTLSPYSPPRLVTFSGAARSACGYAIAMGPFYCPRERRLYVDLDFLRELRQRFPALSRPPGQPPAGAAGDYGAAYVIAHEIGHHVQNLTGSGGLAEQLLETASEEDARTINLIVELQADCYAGIWARNAGIFRELIDNGDVEAALAAATTIGNDMLQQSASGYVMPDSFTHGTEEQRARWFRLGLTSGNLQSCDTFVTAVL